MDRAVLISHRRDPDACPWSGQAICRAYGIHHGIGPLMEFPPEFFGLVAALWNTYQPAILIWMGLMFGAVVALATGIVLWNILHPILNR